MRNVVKAGTRNDEWMILETRNEKHLMETMGSEWIRMDHEIGLEHILNSSSRYLIIYSKNGTELKPRPAREPFKHWDIMV